MSNSSKTDKPEGAAPETILVGEVLRPHGVRGEVVVASYSDVPGRYAPDAGLTMRERGGETRSMKIRAARPHRSGWVVSFAGIDDRDAAAALAGASLEVPREAVPPVREGAFYLFELVGCRCRDRRAGDLGEVAEVLADGGGWLLVARREDGFRLAIPFVERFVVAIDRERRTIEWDLPEGLIEACASTS
jgi:16S rRNA processing protein RimM